MILVVDLGSGEPFAAHLIGYDIAATAALAGEAINRVCGNDGERATRENPEVHRSRPGVSKKFAPGSCKIKSALLLQNAPI